MDLLFNKLKEFKECSIIIENGTGFTMHFDGRNISNLYENDGVIEVYLSAGGCVSLPNNNIVKWLEDEDGIYVRLLNDIDICFIR